MKPRTISTLAAGLLLASAALAQQAPQGPKPLPPGYSVIPLDAAQQGKLDLALKEQEILELRVQVIKDQVEKAQAQMVIVDAQKQQLVVGTKAEVEEIRKANHFGDDVNFDFERLAFVRSPKPAPAAPAAPSKPAAAAVPEHHSTETSVKADR